MRFPVLQVGGRELRPGLDEVIEASYPERFQIQQMADLFLDGPFFRATRDETVAGDVAQQFLNASRRTTKADTEIGIEFLGETKLELAFEPLAGVAHEASVAGGWPRWREARPTHTGIGATIWPRCGATR